MSDRALSEEALRAALRDIHLPEMAAGGAFSDMAASIALAGFAALLVGGALRLLSRNRRKATETEIATRLDALAERSEEERRVALLHLLKSRAPARFAELREALYRPDSGIDSDRLEAELRDRA